MDDKAQEYIGYAVEGAARMSQLVHDLLEYSRIGRPGLDLQPTDASRVMETAMTNLQEAILKAGAKVSHDPLPMVLGDAMQKDPRFSLPFPSRLHHNKERPP